MEKAVYTVTRQKVWIGILNQVNVSCCLQVLQSIYWYILLKLSLSFRKN